MRDRTRPTGSALWHRMGALCAVATAAGFAAGPAAGQSLTQSIQNALAGNCTALAGHPLGPQLGALCTSIPGFAGATAPEGGNPSGPSDQGGQDQESRTKKRLDDLRLQKSGITTPQMNQFADASGSDGTFDLGQLSGFFNFDYQNVSKHTTFFTNGFNSDRYGGTVGIDKSFEKFVLGAAAEYSHTDGNFSGNGGNFGIDSYGGSLYGSYAPIDNMFIDATVGYAHKDNTINRGITFSNTGNPFTVAGTAQGTPSAEEFRANFGTGYDFVHENITFGPRIGLSYSHNDVDAFNEKGITGLELGFGKQTFESLTSSIGARATIAISTSFGVIVPQVSADYIHEFADDQQTFTARFVQDLGAAPTLLIFQTDNPHRDYMGLGIGAVMGLPHGISSFVNYRALVGDSLKSTQTVTAGIRIEF